MSREVPVTGLDDTNNKQRLAVDCRYIVIYNKTN